MFKVDSNPSILNAISANHDEQGKSASVLDEWECETKEFADKDMSVLNNDSTQSY